MLPSVSILCQPTVAVVDEVANRRESSEVAEEYLGYLYSDEAQRLEAQNYFRPYREDILQEFATEDESNVITEVPEDDKWIITDINLTDISHFGGWAAAGEKHFADDAIFDSIYER